MPRLDKDIGSGFAVSWVVLLMGSNFLRPRMKFNGSSSRNFGFQVSGLASDLKQCRRGLLVRFLRRSARFLGFFCKQGELETTKEGPGREGSTLKCRKDDLFVE
jgi:hypothetical protein